MKKTLEIALFAPVHHRHRGGPLAGRGDRRGSRRRRGGRQPLHPRMRRPLLPQPRPADDWPRLHGRVVRPCAKRARPVHRGAAGQPDSSRLVHVRPGRNATVVVRRRRHVQRQHGDGHLRCPAHRWSLDPELQSRTGHEQHLGIVDVHVHRLHSREGRFRVDAWIRRREHEPDAADAAGRAHVLVNAFAVATRLVQRIHDRQPR